MRLSRWFAISGLIAPLAQPVSLDAQASSGAQIFSAIDNSFPGGAGVAGFGITLGNGSIGARGSFGLGFSGLNAPSGSPARTTSRPWVADADFVLGGHHFGTLAGILAGVLEPYAFAGVGAQSVSSSPYFNAAAKTWSYGGGVTVPLGSALGISGEARHRNQLGNAPVAATDFVNGSEYRIGISFSFGSGRTNRGYGTESGPASSPRPSGRSRSPGGSAWPAGSMAASAAARRVVPDAEQYIGVPYVYGGSSPRGFDCSGLIQYVYAREGVDLPRTSRQMAGSGVAVSPSAMTIGDLMLFTQGGRISHVAIYAGSGRFIHSSSSGGGVRYDNLNTERGQWFADHLVAVRRVTRDGRAVVNAFAGSTIPFDHFDPPDSAPPARKK
jgi:cell wall-associated NlpC family hydrolase